MRPRCWPTRPLLLHPQVALVVAVIGAALYPTVVVPLQIAYGGRERPVRGDLGCCPARAWLVCSGRRWSYPLAHAAAFHTTACCVNAVFTLTITGA